MKFPPVKAIFLSHEEKVRKKDNTTYEMVSLMVGTEVATVMSDFKLQAPFGTEFDAVFDHNLKYGNLKLLSAEKCSK